MGRRSAWTGRASRNPQLRGLAANYGCRTVAASMTDQLPTLFDGRAPLDNPLHERFAAALVKHGGCKTPAYVEVFGAEGHVRQTLWVMACRLAGSPLVDARYNALRNEALARVNVSLASLVKDLHDIATADPTELVSTVVTNCRHCNGFEFKYQWIDEDEFVDKCDEVQADNDLRRAESKTGRTVDKPLPPCEGGFGYDPRRNVNPACPACLGVGVRNMVVAETATLSEKGRKLLKGVRMTPGGLEVVMHDQIAARDMLHRMAGAYRDGAKLPGDPGSDPGEAIDMDHITPENAKDSYMSLIHGDA